MESQQLDFISRGCYLICVSWSIYFKGRFWSSVGRFQIAKKICIERTVDQQVKAILQISSTMSKPLSTTDVFRKWLNIHISQLASRLTWTLSTTSRFFSLLRMFDISHRRMDHGIPAFFEYAAREQKSFVSLSRTVRAHSPLFRNWRKRFYLFMQQQ